MYEIIVNSEFSAAHRLRGYEGKCEKLHGHNWQVEVTASKKNLDKLGMVMDFKVLKTILNEILKPLDHAYLNDVPYFKKANPTSENISEFIYYNLKRAKVPVRIVKVWETDSSSAVFFE